MNIILHLYIFAQLETSVSQSNDLPGRCMDPANFSPRSSFTSDLPLVPPKYQSRFKNLFKLQSRDRKSVHTYVLKYLCR